MATRTWRGAAEKKTKVITCTVGGTIETGDLFKVASGSKSVTVAAPSTDANETAEAIATAVALLCAQPSLYPEFGRFACAYVDSTATFTLTAVTAGADFLVTLTTTESNGDPADDQTFGQTDTVAGGGPNWWSVAENWAEGAVPANSDDVVLDGAIDILYGLAQSGVTLASLSTTPTFTAKVGLPPINTGGSGSGASPYAEDLPQELAISATAVTIRNCGGRFRLNTGSNQTTINILGTGKPVDTGVKTMLWKGAHASNVVNIVSGSFAAANYAGDAATIDTLRISFANNKDSDADVFLGAGCTLGDIIKSGGALEVNAGFDDLDGSQGGQTIIGGGTPAIVRAIGSKIIHRTTGTITTLELGSGAEFDRRQDLRAATITDCTLHRGCAIADPLGTLTFTNPIARTAALVDLKLELGGAFSMAAI